VDELRVPRRPGPWSEVDLLLLCPGGLHLVELKYYAGRLRRSLEGGRCCRSWVWLR